MPLLETFLYVAIVGDGYVKCLLHLTFTWIMVHVAGIAGCRLRLDVFSSIFPTEPSEEGDRAVSWWCRGMDWACWHLRGAGCTGVCTLLWQVQFKVHYFDSLVSKLLPDHTLGEWLLLAFCRFKSATWLFSFCMRQQFPSFQSPQRS